MVPLSYFLHFLSVEFVSEFEFGTLTVCSYDHRKLHATIVITSLCPPSILFRTIIEGRLGISDIEEGPYESATTSHSSHDELGENMKSIMRNLTKEGRESIALQARLETRGCERKRKHNINEWYDNVIRDDMFGYEERRAPLLAFLATSTSPTSLVGATNASSS